MTAAISLIKNVSRKDRGFILGSESIKYREFYCQPISVKLHEKCEHKALVAVAELQPKSIYHESVCLLIDAQDIPSFWSCKRIPGFYSCSIFAKSPVTRFVVSLALITLPSFTAHLYLKMVGGCRPKHLCRNKKSKNVITDLFYFTFIWFNLQLSTLLLRKNNIDQGH